MDVSRFKSIRSYSIKLGYDLYGYPSSKESYSSGYHPSQPHPNYGLDLPLNRMANAISSIGSVQTCYLGGSDYRMSWWADIKVGVKSQAQTMIRILTSSSDVDTLQGIRCQYILCISNQFDICIFNYMYSCIPLYYNCIL